MTPDQIAEIKERAEKHAQAIGPGGEKAWLAGQLATDVTTLLAEVERQEKALAMNHEGERYAEELIEKLTAGRDKLAHQAREWRREAELRRAALAAVEKDRDQRAAALNRLERQVIVALSEESLSCRYHGTEFDFLGTEYPGGPPRCDSCKRPWRLTQLLIAAGGVVPGCDGSRETGHA